MSVKSLIKRWLPLMSGGSPCSFRRRSRRSFNGFTASESLETRALLAAYQLHGLDFSPYLNG